MAATGLEEKYDAVKQLIAIGKERGYLLYDEVNDSLPAEVHSSEEIDDLLTTFERNGIEIYEDSASAKAARAVEVVRALILPDCGGRSVMGVPTAIILLMDQCPAEGAMRHNILHCHLYCLH